MTSGTGFLRDLARAMSWHRRLVAAGLAAASVAAALHVLAPPPPATVPVLVAAHDLPSGARLTRSDLVAAPLPPDVVPDGAFRSGERPVGRVVAAPMRAGEPITDVRLFGPSLLTAYGRGIVAAPVRLADAGSVALLHAGDHIDVLAAPTGADPAGGDPAGTADVGGGDPARVVAGGATVLAVPAGGPDTTDGGLVSGGLVVLAVPHATAAALARAAVTARLSAVLRRSGA